MGRPAKKSPARLRVEVRGAVQGVGFRPFVYRLATELGLAGWVRNDSRGVDLEVEGPAAALEVFRARLEAERPPRAVIDRSEARSLEPTLEEGFHIRHSDGGGPKTVFVLPDVATCEDCLAEVLDPRDRRHLYPFTNCTNCGPRFTIIHRLPYDRPHTTMERFPMCPDCRREYGDPLDRRFHAQPNACPRCGPRLALWDENGQALAAGEEALEQAAAALGSGEIVAVKGLGGFHLVVDAADPAAVTRLRERKRRLEKPLALMVQDLEMAERLCEVPAAARQLLTSPEAPIVLLRRRPEAAFASAVAPAVAPGNPELGLMLPYTPLHHLLLGACGRPLVATSGNLSDEPIATDENDARQRLGKIADFFLVHDRPIARHADDSVARLLGGRPQLIRRARGYAPLPLRLPRPVQPLLALGAHLKNVVALALGEQVFLSQHVGDMETPRAVAAFERVVRDFLELYEAEPVALAHDLHPDYASTRFARRAVVGEIEWAPLLAGLPLVGVQHHHAHLVSTLVEHGTLAEHGIMEQTLGVTWDGTGYGLDGTIWGGEFLLGNAVDFIRVAHLRPFRLPGGEAAVEEPRRVALALLHELEGPTALERRDIPAVAAFSDAERRVLGRMLERGLNAPVTSSAGRLFDAVAALAGVERALGGRISFEGQAAMALEHAADPDERGAYPLPLVENEERLVLDWGPLVEALLDDRQRGVSTAVAAARFHNALVTAIVAVARHVGVERVALSGGCFLNRRLCEPAADALRAAGFEVLVQRRVPPGDGGVSLGQAVVAAELIARR